MKISGRVVSKKPISLSRAAKLISRFAAVENGSSPAVSMYLQRSSEAFNQLVQFHAMNKNLNNLHTDKDSEKIAGESELTNSDKKEKKKKRKKNKKGEEAEKSGSKKKSRVDS